MKLLFIIGIAQALFFCLYMITSKGNKLSKGLLSIWLILISFSMLLIYFYETGIINKFPHLIGLDTAFPFIYMPILYFYAKLLVTPDRKLKPIDALHLIPFVSYFIYVWINFYSQSASYKLEFLQKLSNAEYPLDIQIANIFKILQAIIYLFLVFSIIQQHQHRIKLNFSYTESINLSWLKVIAICLSVIYVLKFMGVISIYFSHDSFLARSEGISDLAIILFVFIIAFYGVKQPDIFAKWTTTDQEQKIEVNEEGKFQLVESNDNVISQRYRSSNLSNEEAQELLNALQKYMEDEKPFLKSQITIKDLADALNVNVKNLSQVINEQLGLNFFNYINEYRVNEVKKRILAPEYRHLSMLGIALDCGFNSKSSFNSVFKKQTGQTPTDYKSSVY